MSYRIALAVQGRFHMFDLGRELLARGHDVHVFTNYPPFAAKRFGIPSERVHSFLAHGVTTRVCGRVLPARAGGLLERIGNSTFARWAARAIPRHKWDIVFSMSGIAKELFTALAGRPTLTILHRGSSHIRTQRQLLEEEERRVGRWIEKPSDWIIAREEREYELADAIHVLSEFAYNSFLDHGVDPGKLYRLRLGVSTERFRPPAEGIEARCRRLLAGERLRIIYVGTFSAQKGAYDFQTLTHALRSEPFEFRIVGPIANDARFVMRELAPHVHFVGKRPQQELPEHYSWGDLFVFPTIQDGFAVVLTQALASGLPIITTTNCAGPDLIREDMHGWIVPIRSPEAIIERLRWCHLHREEVAAIVRRVHQSSHSFDWKETAEMAERNVNIARDRKRKSSESKLQSETP
jgi:glycosyltransferase involved in cell wall biosynthesis